MFATLLSSAVLSVAAPAAAPEPFAVTISVADLNLATSEGQAALRDRMRRAMRAACTPAPYPAMYDRESLKACRASFKIAAQRQIASSRGAAAGLQ